MEIDADFFPDDPLAGQQEALLTPGQMIIWSDALTVVADHLRHLRHRASNYDEYPRRKDPFIEEIDYLLDLVGNVIRTNQGQA
jgi:hypothetical protein